MDEKYCLYVGTQLTVFHAAKLFVRLNYVKSPFTKKKYESCKACNTWVSFHICKSFTKIFGSKNKSECIGGFSLNLPTVSVWLNMYDTNGYLHWSLQTRCNLWPDMSDLGRIFKIADDFNFSWPWHWLHWKAHFLIFLCIWRTYKSDMVHILCINLKTRWSWTPRLTRSQTL
jgi:hypothetical protein